MVTPSMELSSLDNSWTSSAAAFIYRVIRPSSFDGSGIPNREIIVEPCFVSISWTRGADLALWSRRIPIMVIWSKDCTSLFVVYLSDINLTNVWNKYYRQLKGIYNSFWDKPRDIHAANVTSAGNNKSERNSFMTFYTSIKEWE